MSMGSMLHIVRLIVKREAAPEARIPYRPRIVFSAPPRRLRSGRCRAASHSLLLIDAGVKEDAQDFSGLRDVFVITQNNENLPIRAPIIP